MPRQFFENHLKPNYDEWMASPLDDRRAKNAVGDANNMAARVFHYWNTRDPAQIYNATSEGSYRNELVSNECTDFGLIRDVAEAYKHVELNRSSRQLTRTEQTRAEPHVYGGASYYGAAHYGGNQLVVMLDDGTKRPLAMIMQNVMEMWEELLNRWGI